MRKTRRSIAAALATAAALAAFTGSAFAAASGTQLVSGTTIGTLAIAATPAVLDTNFNPGYTASNATPAAVIVTATGGWTLTIDDATNNGHLVKNAANPLCATSAGSTAHQLRVQTAGGTSATHVAGPVTVAAPVSNVGATVATGTLANALTSAYTLAIDPIERMVTGCDYSTTVNWTIQ